MAFLDKTKYKNNVRTIIGSPQIYPDDVILLCDTSVGPVTINLLDIPVDFWSTQWQMYIVDKSGNASVNNITINAGTGQIINGSASIVLNTANAYANIRIGANLKYIATTSAGGGASVNGHIIADEGSNLPQQPILDFVGAGVTASNGVGKTTITIPGGAPIIPTTNANLLTLINTNSIQPGAYYLITDVLNSPEGVLVTGLLTNGNTSVQGIGLFLNADYQGVGNYSGVVGYSGFLNIWYSTYAGAVALGNVVIYNNRHYKNLTGVWGTNPPSDLVNWEIIAPSVTGGYIRATDFVYYDLYSNFVITRIDNKENEVDFFTGFKSVNSLEVFQWGRNSTFANKVKSGSIYNNCNSYCVSQIANNLFSGGTIEDTTGGSDPGTINRNTLSNGAYLLIRNNKGTIDGNIINTFSQVKIDNINANAFFQNNIIGNESVIEIFGVAITEYGIINTTINYGTILITNSSSVLIDACNIHSGGGISITDALPLSRISKCEIGNTMKVKYANYNRIVENKRVVSGFSNWDETLDFNDPAVWNGVSVLTIPLNFDFVGIFTTLNSILAPAVAWIVNGPSNHDFRIQPDSTSGVKVQHTAYAFAVAGNMLCDASPSTNTLVGRVSGTDFVEYRKSNLMYLRTNIVVVT
jgi:hypothetical protein